MENNNQHDELLVRYLFNEETEEEKVFVENWLNASEENKRYFNRLKKAWQLTEIKQDLGYLMDEAKLEEKWNRLEQNLTEKARIIPIDQQEVSEGEYVQEEKPDRKPLVYRLFVSTAIAASVLLVIGLGWILLRNQTGDKSSIAVNEKNAASPLQMLQRVNTTNKTMTVLLEDGSTVELEPNSYVKYYKPFDVNNKRIVYLEGQALFKVAKDKSKPFTVFSNDLATTALGTSFTVKSFIKSNVISVSLHEGKVVVRSADSVEKKLKKDFFLLPGDQLIYNKTTAVASVHHSGENEKEKMGNASPSERNRAIKKPDWYKFDGLPLDQVFEQLKVYYQVEIHYSSSDIRNMYFTGRIEKEDSLENILNDIALLNHLTFSKKNGSYLIQKKN